MQANARPVDQPRLGHARDPYPLHGTGLLASLADGEGNTLTYFYDEFYWLSEIGYPYDSYELIG